MPFNAARLETTNRLFELQQYHRLLVTSEHNIPAPAEHQILKGHFIVGLYAYLECSIQQIVKAAVAHVNSLNVAHKHIAPELFALHSEPKFMAVANTKGDKRRHYSRELVESIYTSKICLISDSVLSREIQNTRTNTIELIFKMFAINASPIDPSTRAIGFYINEIGERRNAVAHGRESASDVGGRYTVNALSERLIALESQILYMINCFEDCTLQKRFIRKECRRYYR